MAIILKHFKPAVLTGYGREAARAVDNTVLARIFPNRVQQSTVAEWTVNDRNRNEAQYRAYGAETEFGRRPGKRVVTQRLAPLGLKLPYTEDDALLALNGVEAEQTVVDRLAAAVSESVTYTLEKNRAAALELGRYTARGVNFSAEIDFARNPAHTTTAPTLFSAAGADPVSYINSLVELVQRNSGVRPNLLVTSSRVFAALAKSSAMISYAGGSSTSMLVTRDAIQATLAAFGLPQITVYDELDANDARLTADNKIFLASDTGVGETSWGPTVASRNPRYGIRAGDAPGLFVGLYEEEDADTKYVRSDASALAVLQRPDATAAAVVL